jgi:hypothetical protein
MMDRLRDRELSDFERTLLDAADDDGPSDGLGLRILTAAGAAATVATAASTAKGAPSTGVTAAPGAVPSAAPAAVTSLVTKAAVAKLAVLLLGCAVATGVVMARRVATPPPAALHDDSVAHDEPSTATLPAVAPVPEPSAAPVAALPAPARTTRPKVSSPNKKSDVALAPSASATSSDGDQAIGSEVALLDGARSALVSGKASDAVARLAAYDARFPRGALRQERVVLEVRARLALGQTARAQSVVDTYLNANPTSAQAARLRAMVGEKTTEPTPVTLTR